MDVFDLYQQSQIRANNRQMRFNADANDHRHNRARDEIDAVHGRVDRLLLINEAMWSLICEHSSLTEEDLAARVEELDRSDGAVNGRRQPRASDCHCGAKINPKDKRCLFCEAEAPPRPTFDLV